MVNNMIIIIAVILACTSFVVFALALLADLLRLTELEEILLNLSLAGLSMSIILIIFGVFIFIIFDLPNFI